MLHRFCLLNLAALPRTQKQKKCRQHGGGRNKISLILKIFSLQLFYTLCIA